MNAAHQAAHGSGSAFGPFGNSAGFCNGWGMAFAVSWQRVDGMTYAITWAALRKIAITQYYRDDDLGEHMRIAEKALETEQDE